MLRSNLLTGFGVPRSIPLLLDRFDTGSLSSIWTTSGGTITVPGGVLDITGSSSAYVRTANSYDIADRSVQVRFINVPAPNTGYSQQLRVSTSDAFTSNYLAQVFNGTLYLQDSVTGILFSMAHDPVNHEYLRFRFIAGTTYFDTSANGVSWVNRYSGSYSVVSTIVYMYLRSNYISGGSVTHQWDDFITNIPL